MDFHIQELPELPRVNGDLDGIMIAMVKQMYQKLYSHTR